MLSCNNPNIQKQTRKAMYGPEGNSDGSAAFMSAQAMSVMLKSSGVPLKGKPFELFYYLIKDVFMGKDVNAEEANINKFAKQLETLTTLFNAWEDIKEEVYASASGTDTSQKFVIKVATLLNRLLKPLGFKFPTNGQAIESSDFHSALQMVNELSAYGMKQDFPVLGNNVISLLDNLSSLSKYFCEDKRAKIEPISLLVLWKDVQSGGSAIPKNGNMPNPEAYSSVQDSLSEGASILSGISASNSSKLQYAQNEYNRLNAFVHNMLSAWLNIRKGLLGKMAQARN